MTDKKQTLDEWISNKSLVFEPAAESNAPLRQYLIQTNIDARQMAKEAAALAFEEASDITFKYARDLRLDSPGDGVEMLVRLGEKLRRHADQLRKKE